MQRAITKNYLKDIEAIRRLSHAIEVDKYPRKLHKNMKSNYWYVCLILDRFHETGIQTGVEKTNALRTTLLCTKKDTSYKSLTNIHTYASHDFKSLFITKFCTQIINKKTDKFINRGHHVIYVTYKTRYAGYATSTALICDNAEVDTVFGKCKNRNIDNLLIVMIPDEYSTRIQYAIRALIDHHIFDIHNPFEGKYYIRFSHATDNIKNTDYGGYRYVDHHDIISEEFCDLLDTCIEHGMQCSKLTEGTGHNQTTELDISNQVIYNMQLANHTDSDGKSEVDMECKMDVEQEYEDAESIIVSTDDRRSVVGSDNCNMEIEKEMYGDDGDDDNKSDYTDSLFKNMTQVSDVKDRDTQCNAGINMNDCFSYLCDSSPYITTCNAEEKSDHSTDLFNDDWWYNSTNNTEEREFDQLGFCGKSFGLDDNKSIWPEYGLPSNLWD